MAGVRWVWNAPWFDRRLFGVLAVLQFFFIGASGGYDMEAFGGLSSLARMASFSSFLGIWSVPGAGNSFLQVPLKSLGFGVNGFLYGFLVGRLRRRFFGEDDSPLAGRSSSALSWLALGIILIGILLSLAPLVVHAHDGGFEEIGGDGLIGPNLPTLVGSAAGGAGGFTIGIGIGAAGLPGPRRRRTGSDDDDDGSDDEEEEEPNEVVGVSVAITRDDG